MVEAAVLLCHLTVVVVVMFLSADMPVHTLGLMEASEQRLERCSVTPGNTNQ